MTEYTFSKLTTGDYKEKTSSFHAVAQSASSVDMVKTKLLTIKAEYPDASHICYAYRIKRGQQLDEYSSDAGEPRGSAGQPMLNVLKRENLINVAIFVVRNFGGIKLGIPGLIHAYGTAAENAIKKVELKPWMKTKRLRITYPYKLEGILNSILKKNKAKVIHEAFGEQINIQLDIDIKLANEFINSINELSFGSAQIIIED